jgi:hypothetical protein
MEKYCNIIFLGDRIVRKDYKKKANYQDSFEDLYLKHDYLTRVKEYKTPIKSYENIVKTTAAIMFDKHKMTFYKVGFALDDIVNISWTYLHSFLGIYSFESNPESLDKFKATFLKSKSREPISDEIIRKERNNIINFLRQKLQTCVIFCERKSRNIVVSRGDVAYFALTSRSIPVSYNLLLEDYDFYGYRKVSESEYRKSKAAANKLKTKEVKDINGFKIVSVNTYSEIPVSLFNTAEGWANEEWAEIDHSTLSPSAEEFVLEMEDDVYLSKYEQDFDSTEKLKKKSILKKFIADNAKNKRLKVEIRMARKMLEQLNVV